MLKIEKSLLGISNCHAECPKCKLPTAEFKMFESGFGDFKTYLGEKTGNIYEIDMGMTYYQGIPFDNLINLIAEFEGGLHFLRPIPERIKCKICGNEFTGHTISIDSEEQIYAFHIVNIDEV